MTLSPAREAPWHLIEPLPRSLWLPALVCSVGTAAARLTDAQRWRLSLQAGELPPSDALFGDAQAVAPLREQVATLGLPGLCRHSPALAEQVLRTLLWHLDRIVSLQPQLTRPQAIAQVGAEFAAAWTLEKTGWEEVLALLQGLGDLAQLRWDTLAGRLTRREWQEARRIQQRLAQLPELAALLERIGRSRHAPAAPPRPAEQPQDHPQRPLGLRAVTTVLPDAPGELTGICHSDRPERMLASEAVQLHHPVLRKLWRARRAEGRLLSWDSQAVLTDWRTDPSAPPQQASSPPQLEPRDCGPIVLCLDTSGSMRGAPENIAKAVALHAFRVAHRSGRACKLIAFGGAGEVQECDMGLDGPGLDALLALLGQSFDGGTDVQTPIERALAAVAQARWRSADLLIVSDGEFGCTPATLAHLDQVRTELGLRVQGVLVGDRETLGLMEVCDDIFWVRDWRRHGDQAGASGFSPVHSKSLTALYFPNALSPRAARHRQGA